MSNYECGKSTGILIFKKGNRATFPLLCNRVTGASPCISCLARRVDRLINQVKHELASGPLYWREFGEIRAKRVSHRLRDMGRRIRYKSFPLASERMAFITNYAGNQYMRGELLPTDAGELRTLIQRFASTPKGKRIGGTRATKDSVAFGGKYSGYKSKLSVECSVLYASGDRVLVESLFKRVGAVEIGESLMSNGETMKYFAPSASDTWHRADTEAIENGIDLTPRKRSRKVTGTRQ